MGTEHVVRWAALHPNFAFWAVLAAGYFTLALLSAWASRAYGGRLEKAQPQWTGKNTTSIDDRPGEGDKPLYVFPDDLLKYLNAVTWVTSAGFVLAAAAAWVSACGWP